MWQGPSRLHSRLVYLFDVGLEDHLAEEKMEETPDNPDQDTPLPPCRGSFRALSPAAAKKTVKGAAKKRQKAFQKGVLGLFQKKKKYIYIHVYIHICPWQLVSMDIDVYLCIYVFVHTYQCMYVSHVCIYTYTDIHVCNIYI